MRRFMLSVVLVGLGTVGGYLLGNKAADDLQTFRAANCTVTCADDDKVSAVKNSKGAAMRASDDHRSSTARTGPSAGVSHRRCQRLFNPLAWAIANKSSSSKFRPSGWRMSGLLRTQASE